MLTIRAFDFSDEDYAAMLVIESAVFPEYTNSTEEWKHIDGARNPAHGYRRDIIERNGTPIAFGDCGQAYWLDDDGTYEFNVYVHPDHEAADVRPAYLQLTLAAFAAHNPRTLITGMFSDHAAHIRFLLDAGFAETMRELESELDVMAFDAARFEPVAARVRAAGIRIVPLSALQQSDPDWKREIYELRWTLSQDVPSTEPRSKPTFESFEAHILNSPHFVPEAWFVALDGDQYVGMSRGWIDGSNAAQFNNELTGTLRSHRRRGIATALKLHVIAFARENGARVIITGNAEGNPMYALNQKLGFRPKPAWIHFCRIMR